MSAVCKDCGSPLHFRFGLPTDRTLTAPATSTTNPTKGLNLGSIPVKRGWYLITGDTSSNSTKVANLALQNNGNVLGFPSSFSGSMCWLARCENGSLDIVTLVDDSATGFVYHIDNFAAVRIDMGDGFGFEGCG